MRTRILTFLFLALSGASLFAAISEPIKLDSGQVSGIATSTPEVRAFKGIPFAAPPVGDLRWKAPQPAPKWEGVRAADKFSATCMQGGGGGGAAGKGKGAPGAAPNPVANQTAPAPPSEDCLYLN